MTLALRAHHLLCMLTYAGRGYSPDFVRNFDHITARLAAGAPITLVHGPDAICAPLCCGPDGTTRTAIKPVRRRAMHRQHANWRRGSAACRALA